MIYNTKKFTNIRNQVFNGRYSGVDFDFQPQESRYLPVMVAEHLASQLAIILECEVDELLGELIPTKEENKKLSIKEEVEQHEKEFVEWQEQQQKEKVAKTQEALKKIKNV